MDKGLIVSINYKQYLLLIIQSDISKFNPIDILKILDMIDYIDNNSFHKLWNYFL